MLQISDLFVTLELMTSVQDHDTPWFMVDNCETQRGLKNVISSHTRKEKNSCCYGYKCIANPLWLPWSLVEI